MFLLRFVPEGTQVGRINCIISNENIINDDDYWYEYRLLLRDRLTDISGKSQKVFTDWVDSIVISKEEREYFTSMYEENKGDRKKPDFDKAEAVHKARELYLVRKKEPFSEIYNKYKLTGGSIDADIAPIPIVSEARFVSPKEGAPGNSDDMFAMEPVEAIEYINTPSRWIIEKTNEWAHHTPEVALSHVFEDVVKGKLDDYTALGLEHLQKLKPVFLERYFNGIINAFREKNLKEGSLLNILNNSKCIVETNLDNSSSNWSFRLILEIIEIIFNREELKKSIVPGSGELIWIIIKTLRTYQHDRERFSSSRGAHSECINSVSGKAFELVIRFGLFFKNLDENEYNEQWSDKLRGNIKDVIDNVNERWVRCVLGVNFPQIHWLEQEFTEENIDNIFDISDSETWKDVWGSYLSWSRAYRNIFTFLRQKGKYAETIGNLGILSEGRDLAKRVDEGLMQHLMIAYYNGWIEWEDSLLKQFFDEAPVDLRAEAVSFLHTGFKPTREGGNLKGINERADRIRRYWQDRLTENIKNGNNESEEVERLLGWIEDTLLEPTETLELTLQTLELTGGKISKNRDEIDLVKGACKIGIGNELLTLKCMTKMMEGKPEWLAFSLYKEELVNFLDHIIGLSEDTNGIVEIRNEAIELINAYGRRQIDDLKPYYEKIKKGK